MISNIYYLEDNNFYFVWKPAGLATSFGLQHSFLDQILEQKPPFFLALQEQFGKEEEFGLVNRLDNDTQWFIYFAKTPKIKSQYEKRQDEKKLIKQYVCDVQGKVDIRRTTEKIAKTKLVTWFLPAIQMQNLLWMVMQKYPDFDDKKNNSRLWKIDLPSVYTDLQTAEMLAVSLPIMHSASSAERMVAILDQKDTVRGRGKPHDVKTFLLPLEYNEAKNTTRCIVFIQQGIRHQIRVHLAKIGYPIVGDVLYGHTQNPIEKDNFLHLWSVWFGYPQKDFST